MSKVIKDLLSQITPQQQKDTTREMKSFLEGYYKAIEDMKGFKLNEKEDELLQDFKTEIVKKFGNYGSLSYTFTPTGIGNKIEVYSKLLNKTKDITDYESW